MRKLPSSVLVSAGVLAALRELAFWVIHLNVREDIAQWQFYYIPLQLADFPISVVYMLLRVPFPFADAVIGPIWWFFLPLIAWRLAQLWTNRKRKIAHNPTSGPTLASGTTPAEQEPRLP
jgi:hypothetical protein